MQDLEQRLRKGLQAEPEQNFERSDEQLIQRAVTTVSVEQGGKDFISLGLASIWVVFASIFMNLLKPVFKTMAKNRSK
ncbi:hypothetical protein J7384_04190 [Endozoicomonas sp. G2_1]|uniref:hypothetical protein n=1 Tax=Endozoicomonas sp. G2_1 TaxID=2821091 RepID=UPI001ADB13FA|nr:hypothetical protein [Endozoicomonas sp. G2_1]MBO9489557.1 hypothetical protein [Endozoicomonas sp. G2_1]